MNILELQSIHKSFGDVGVLRGVDFTLAKGEYAAIMGPSGSGKSTLLHLAAGLLLPDNGGINVNGAALPGMDDDARTVFRRRNIGLVFQDFNLIPTLTAEENILLPLLLDKAAVDRGHIDGLLARFELAARRGHYPHQLSGGERQRVAIARALAMRPCLLLADEPTGNLDILSGRKFCDVLAEIHAGYGTSILLVSHDPVVASRASRVAILMDGKIQADFASQGGPTELSSRYLALIHNNSCA